MPMGRRSKRDNVCQTGNDIENRHFRTGKRLSSNQQDMQAGPTKAAASKKRRSLSLAVSKPKGSLAGSSSSPLAQKQPLEPILAAASTFANAGSTRIPHPVSPIVPPHVPVQTPQRSSHFSLRAALAAAFPNADFSVSSHQPLPRLEQCLPQKRSAVAPMGLQQGASEPKLLPRMPEHELNKWLDMGEICARYFHLDIVDEKEDSAAESPGGSASSDLSADSPFPSSPVVPATQCLRIPGSSLIKKNSNAVAVPQGLGGTRESNRHGKDEHMLTEQPGQKSPFRSSKAGMEVLGSGKRRHTEFPGESANNVLSSESDAFMMMPGEEDAFKSPAKKIRLSDFVNGLVKNEDSTSAQVDSNHPAFSSSPTKASSNLMKLTPVMPTQAQGIPSSIKLPPFSVHPFGKVSPRNPLSNGRFRPSTLRTTGLSPPVSVTASNTISDTSAAFVTADFRSFPETTGPDAENPSSISALVSGAENGNILRPWARKASSEPQIITAPASNSNISKPWAQKPAVSPVGHVIAWSTSGVGTKQGSHNNMGGTSGKPWAQESVAATNHSLPRSTQTPEAIRARQPTPAGINPSPLSHQQTARKPWERVAPSSAPFHGPAGGHLKPWGGPATSATPVMASAAAAAEPAQKAWWQRVGKADASTGSAKPWMAKPSGVLENDPALIGGTLRVSQKPWESRSGGGTAGGVSKPWMNQQAKLSLVQAVAALKCPMCCVYMPLGSLPGVICASCASFC